MKHSQLPQRLREQPKRKLVCHCGASVYIYGDTARKQDRRVVCWEHDEALQKRLSKELKLIEKDEAEALKAKLRK